ncbi:MAG: hypothetical protein WCF33_25280 [Pseudonocardiaceae bacterium]
MPPAELLCFGWLASQPARVNAARRQPGDVSQALALAATAPHPTHP